MKIEPRELQSIQVRHLKTNVGSETGRSVVWWPGALVKNERTKSLPHVLVSCRYLMPNGSLGNFFRLEVGITELGLLQVGTIWEGKACKQQIAFEQQRFEVDFSPGNWRITEQSAHYDLTGRALIPQEV